MGLSFGLLFLLSYAAFVAYLKPPATAALNVRPVITNVEPMLRKMASVPTGLVTDAGASMVVPDVVPRAGLVPAQTMSEAQALPPLPPVAVPVDYTSPDNTFSTLDVVVQSDERPEYRLTAVSELRSIAANGDANGRIRETLRMATADGDPRVAAAANEAYREVSARAQTQAR